METLAYPPAPVVARPATSQPPTDTLPRPARRRLLHLLWELRYSGAEVMVYDAKEYFESQGVYGSIVARGPEFGPYAPTLARAGYPVEHLPARRNLGSFIELYQYLRKHPADIVHLHLEGLFIWHCLAIRLAFPKARIVHTHHDVYFQYPPYLRLKRTFHRWLATKLGVRHVSIGESVQTVEREHFRNDTTIVYNWIDENEFRPPTPGQIAAARQEIGIAPDAFVVLTVGTCNDKKCHNEIFEAVARVKDQIPNLVFLHRGTGDNLPQERDYVKRLGIERHVLFLDYIDYLPKVFWASDGFIFSSHWEGLGNVILQAIACKVPVILYQGWGMNDFRPADPADTYGYWINPDTERFDEALLDLHARKQDGRIEDWREKAYAFYRRKFSAKKSLARMVEQYLGE
ncbi:glycosyltransferase family 4 protein [Hymenobacter psychrotolerans]|uniref:Glycosyltransferase involved in cell wall bisynthesis n=1 Tax=Hymenobacter psychrotolerans DSM 18569 TaxID=1121959 RepID=A0A1M6W5D5_9BACT|nr:glycosyltransferase family 4 protein [Hymenobacter psychrotolerans]SHK88695.1 Glycosyltransferase involved in cell wall bisynthesis [Hymenobacter psychrotolerans DSM 18569]